MRDLERTNKGAYSSSINRKNRLQLSATQTISETLGSINLSASTQDYWNKSGRDTEYQLGYTNAFKWFNFNLNASRTRDLVKDKWDNKIAIGISLPLGNSARSAYLSTTYVQESGHRGLQNSIAGTSGRTVSITGARSSIRMTTTIAAIKPRAASVVTGLRREPAWAAVSQQARATSNTA